MLNPNALFILHRIKLPEDTAGKVEANFTSKGKRKWRISDVAGGGGGGH